MAKKFTPYYCNEALVDVVLSSERIVTDETGEWLVIGYPGVDGIEFRTRVNETESYIYAFYPIEKRYTKIADSADDLLAKWKANKIFL